MQNKYLCTLIKARSWSKREKERERELKPELRVKSGSHRGVAWNRDEEDVRKRKLKGR